MPKILSEDEEYLEYVKEAKALLGIDVEHLIDTIKGSKAKGALINFEYGAFEVTICVTIFRPDDLSVEFQSADRSRKFKAQLIRSNAILEP